MRRKTEAVMVVGAGWLGHAIAASNGVRPAPRRSFSSDDIGRGATVFVTSGRASFARDEQLGDVLRNELGHLREVLDGCQRAEARRVVVLGSADVAGSAERVLGNTPDAPLTLYARVKAALEQECRLRADEGMPVTSVRLAPVHGAGKARSAAMLRLTRMPLIPLPRGGGHSIGFVELGDAIRALDHLGRHSSPPVVAVGGGSTPLRDLLQQLALVQGRHPAWLPLPAPLGLLRGLAPLGFPEVLHWLIRLSLPRVVEMEVPVPITPLPQVAAKLVAAC